MAGSAPRIKISPSVSQESIDAFDVIVEQTGESRGQLIVRLLALELKRLGRRQGG